MIVNHQKALAKQASLHAEAAQRQQASQMATQALESQSQSPAERSGRMDQARALVVVKYVQPKAERVRELLETISKGPSFDHTMRTKALHDLQAIIVAADQAQRTQLKVNIQWMVDYQVVDALNQSVRVANRIEVVDAAVGTIMAMTSALGGDAFDNLADKIIDSILMKSGIQNQGTKEHMKKKAFECLTHILHECRTKKAVALQRVLMHLKDREELKKSSGFGCIGRTRSQEKIASSGDIRTFCVDVLAEVLTLWTEEQLSPHKELILGKLEIVLNDKSKTARQSARTAVVKMCAVWPDDGEALIEKNPKLHKLLRNENSTMESSVLRKAGHPPKRSKKKTPDAPFGCTRSPRQQKRKQNR